MAPGPGPRRTCATVLEQARGCHVELIMKDISTVRYQPQRLWEWAAHRHGGGCRKAHDAQGLTAAAEAALLMNTFFQGE